MKTILLALLTAAALTACKKNEPIAAAPAPARPVATTTTNNNNPPKPIASFVWAVNGTSSLYVATTMSFSKDNKAVTAGNNTTTFDIGFLADSVGTYKITNGNVFTLNNGADNSAVTGDLKITDKSTTTISGSFDVVMNTGGLTSVKGTFTNIAIK